MTALGVEIATDSPVTDLEALRRDGFDAVLVATGTPLSTQPGRPGRGARRRRRRSRSSCAPSGSARAADLTGKRVVVVGGGNVAMDAARTARRLGAAETTVAYRRGREEMPAHKAEVDDAEREGVRFAFQVAPVEVVGDAAGHVTGLRCQRMALGQPDASGRRRPEPITGSEFVIQCDIVLVAIGMAPDTDGLRRALRHEHKRRPSSPIRELSRRRFHTSSPPATSRQAPRTSPGPSARGGGPRT